MNIKEIKKEFGTCDWLRAFLNNYTVEAIIWMIDELDRGFLCSTCILKELCNDVEKDTMKNCPSYEKKKE